MADWFALLNNKMGGDLKKIQTVGRYMIEIWRAVGMDMRNVEFLWASEEINAHSDAYWSRVMEIARLNNLARYVRLSVCVVRASALPVPCVGGCVIQIPLLLSDRPPSCWLNPPLDPNTNDIATTGYSGAAPSWGGRTRTS